MRHECSKCRSQIQQPQGAGPRAHRHRRLRAGLSRAQPQYWDSVFAKLVQQDDWKKDIAASHFANTYLNSADTRRLMETQFMLLGSALRALGLIK